VFNKAFSDTESSASMSIVEDLVTILSVFFFFSVACSNGKLSEMML
jgi:hypothetical protein